MILYLIIVTLFITYFTLSRAHQNRCKSKQIFLLFYIFLGITIGFRDINIGVDTVTYCDTYNKTKGLSLEDALEISYMEFGYVLSSHLFQILGFDYYEYQLVFSITMMYLFGNFFFDNTKYPIFATIVFLGAGFFAFSYNIVRQMMAIAICANGWTFLRKDKYLISLVIILLAALFHMTAFLFLIAVLLYKYRNNTLIRLGFPLFLIFLFTVLPQLFSFIEEFNPYSGYADLNNTGMKGGFVYILWIFELFLIGIILLSKKFSAKDKVIANLACFCVLLAMMDEKVRYLDRIGLIFSPFVCIMFPIVLKHILSYKLKEVYIVGGSICFLMFFIYRSSDLLNYKTFI